MKIVNTEMHLFGRSLGPETDKSDDRYRREAPELQKRSVRRIVRRFETVIESVQPNLLVDKGLNTP